MFGELFGRFLVEENVIDSATGEKLLKEASDAHVKLGMMAVAEGIITSEQADEINRKQQKQDKRFGDIAIEDGYMDQAKLDDLLKRQGTPYMKYIQLLVDETDVEAAQVDELLERFKKKSGFDQAELNAIKEENVGGYISAFATSSQPYITNVAGQVLRNMVRFVTSDFYIDKLKRVEDLPYSALAIQKCYGDHTIYIGLVMSEGSDSFVNVAGHITGKEYDDLSVEAFDAIGEFINNVSGLIVTELASERLSMEIAPQTFYKDQVIKGRGYILPIYVEGKEVDLFISVDNEVNVGTNPLDNRVSVNNTKSEVTNAKATVVVVDDSGWSRKVLRDLLEKNGFAVIGEAGDGGEAIEVYKELNPDIITLDITMPTMDGIEALGHIMEYDKNAKVAMITSAGQRSKVLESLKLGAEKFIVKPYDPNMVLSELKSLVE